MFNGIVPLWMRLAPVGRGADLTFTGFFFGEGLLDLEPSLDFSPVLATVFLDSFFVSVFLRTGALLALGFAGRAAWAARAAHVLLEGFGAEAVALAAVLAVPLAVALSVAAVAGAVFDFCFFCLSPYIIES